MKKSQAFKIVSFLLSIVTILSLVSVLFVLPISANTVNSTVDELKKQVVYSYAQAKKLSGRSTFNGYCGAMAGYQLKALGINPSLYTGNGKDHYNYYAKISNTSAGYKVNLYPANSGSIEYTLNKLTQNGTTSVFNLLLCFEKGSTSKAGQTYGHVMFINGIVDGVVYFCESYNATVGGKIYQEGTVIACNISTFAKYYKNACTQFEGIVHFVSPNTPPANNTLTILYHVNGGKMTESVEIIGQQYQVYTTDGTYANIRRTPGGTIIDALPSGSIVTVLNSTKYGDYNWGAIRYGSGTAYIALGSWMIPLDTVYGPQYYLSDSIVTDGKTSLPVTSTLTGGQEFKDGLLNLPLIRDGYVFEGWALQANSDTILQAEDTVPETTNELILYAIWSKAECVHNFEYKYNDDIHFEVCSLCDVKKESEPHTLEFSFSNDTIHCLSCTVCQYTLKEDHEWDLTYQHDNTSHYSSCSVCECEFVIEEKHTFVNDFCSVCGKKSQNTNSDIESGSDTSDEPPIKDDTPSIDDSFNEAVIDLTNENLLTEDNLKTNNSNILESIWIIVSTVSIVSIIFLGLKLYFKML